MTRHSYFLNAGLSCWLALQLGLIASAAEPYDIQRVHMKDGRVLNMQWTRFGSQPFHLHRRNGIPYCGDHPLRNQPVKLQQILALAAEEVGITGGIETYTRTGPPLTLHLKYAVGVHVETGRELYVMLCSVTPQDQVRILNAANSLKLREERLAMHATLLRAADEAGLGSRVAVEYAQRAAHASEAAAANTDQILDCLDHCNGRAVADAHSDGLSVRSNRWRKPLQKPKQIGRPQGPTNAARE